MAWFEIVFLDHGPRPDRLHQLVLADDSVAVLEKEDEYVVGPRGQVEAGAVWPAELLPQQIDPEVSKPVGAGGGAVQARLSFFQNVSA